MNSPHLQLPERFELKQPLGRGGFGQVYCVHDRERDETVALKVLSEVNATNLMSFKAEFRGLSGLHHPNLVMLYELIEHNGQWFFTMEIIHGVDFLEYIRGMSREDYISHQSKPKWSSELTKATTLGDTVNASDSSGHNSLAMRFTDTFIDNLVTTPQHEDDFELPFFDEDRLRHALRELYHGVSALHRSGILHRDIKPSNVLVDDDGRLAMLDFGLIAQIKPELNVEQLKNNDKNKHIQYIGTPHYMSPEQAMGNKIGPSSDWYSVGAMLYEVLTGRRPVEGGSPLQILVQKNTHDPLDVMELNPSSPRDLAKLCMRLLARNPLDRPSSQEIAQILGVEEERNVVLPTHKRLENTGEHENKLLPFVGRKKELGQLYHALDKVRSDKASGVQLVHVSGPSGMGKSRLMNCFLEAVMSQKDTLVLHGRCFKTEFVPYKALDLLMDMLAKYLEMLPLDKMPDISNIQLAALSILFPTLGQKFELSEQSEVLSQQDSSSLRLLAFDALRVLLGALAEQHTLVLYIDDVHWGDEDSALLLEHVLRPPNAPPLLLLMSWREEDQYSSVFLKSLAKAQQRWNEPLSVTHVQLKELDSDESHELVNQLVEERGVDANLRYHIYKESQGNPLFIGEFVHYASDLKEDESPRLALEDVISRRIKTLEPAARRLLECVCISGQPLERSIARTLAEVNGAYQSTISLLRSELLLKFSSAFTSSVGERRTSDEFLDVYHAKIREAVIHHMNPVNLFSTHEALATILANGDESEPDRIAHHYMEARQGLKAVPYLLKSAERSEKALAMDRAARALETALELGDFSRAQRGEIYTRLGKLYGFLGRGLESVGAYRRAVEFSSYDMQSSLEHRIAEQLLRVGKFEEGRVLLFDLLDRQGVFTPRSNARLLAEIAALRAKLAWRGLQVQDSGALVGDFEEGRTRAELIWSAAQMLSVMDLKLGAYFASLHLLESLESANPDHLCLSLTLEAVHLCGSAKGRAKAVELLRRAEGILPDVQDTGYCSGFVAFGWGMLRYLEGHWVKSNEYFMNAEQILATQCKGVVWELDGARFYQSFCQEHIGGFSWFNNRLPVYLDLARKRQDLLYTTNWRLWSYLTHLVRDEPELANHEVDEAIKEWSTKTFLIQDFWWLISKAKIALYQNEPVWALDLIDSQASRLKRSLLLQNETVEMMTEEVQAQLSMALLLDRQVDARMSRKLRSRCERHISTLSKSSLTFCSLRARGLSLQLAWLDGERRTALKEAELLFTLTMAEGMKPYAYALNMLRALMIGLHEPLAMSLLEEAERWFKAQDVKNPRAFARILCPVLSFLPET